MIPVQEDELLRLYAARSVRAVAETQQLCGRICFTLAARILGSKEDAEECVSDALLAAWNAIPPAQPESLTAYLTALTRNIALNRLKANNRLMRGGGQVPAALDELAECVPAKESVEAEYDRRSFLNAVNAFLGTLPRETRVMFVRRYWYLESSRDIAAAMHIRESKVRVTLMRTRRKLKAYLEQENAE